ncbi:MAG: hypothetical protein Kow0042_21730 [Calditrichia bacterium]
MKFSTFISDVKENSYIEIPGEIRNKLDLRTGDKLEVTIKKIKTRRLDILISRNPLHKLLKLTDE